MTADVGTAGTQSARAGRPATGRVPEHSTLGNRYTIGAILRTTAIAEIYLATDIQTDGQVHIHVFHAPLTATPALRDAVMSAAHEAMALSHPNAAVPRDVGFDGQHCFVVTAPIEGSSLRELLARRAASGAAGLGPRGVINVTDAVGDALDAAQEQGIIHGAISAESIFIDGEGVVSVAGWGAGALMAAAAQARLLAPPPELAPEVIAAGRPTPPGDVFALGMLLYELLIGQHLQKGGPRPSDTVPGLSQTMDQLIARSVSPQAGGRPDLTEFRALLRSAFSAQPSAAATASTAPSLAQSLAPAGVAASVDPALLADTEERWLISKGRLDYGPYGLAEVIEQIRADEILPGNTIIDNHSGQRWSVEEHPILGPLVHQARQARDDRRRANAEVVHAKQETRRGFLLYAVIACSVLGLGGLAYLLITKTSKDEGEVAAAGVSTVGEGEFNAKITFPKADTSKQQSKRRRSSGGSSGGSDDTLALDLGDDSVGSERLDDSVINGIIQGHGGRLGGCLAKNGGGYAKTEFVIQGTTGKVVAVKVNGQQSGGLYSCVNRVMRAIKFPTVDGPRTRAEFEMQL